MYKELTVDELALIDGGKKKKKVACTWGNAATAAASGAVKGILGGGLLVHWLELSGALHNAHLTTYTACTKTFFNKNSILT